MKTFLLKSGFLTIVFLITNLFFAGVAFGQTVTLDQADLDYAPGETVYITGTGWQPNEEIDLQVHHLTEPIPDHGTPNPHDPWKITTDSSGNFIASWFVTDYELGAELLLIADGVQSGFTYEVFFTDANSVLSNPTPSSAVYGSSITISSTLTTNPGGAAIVGRTINFSLNGTNLGSAVTNASGVASLNVTLTIPLGSYNGNNNGLKADFAGDPSNNPYFKTSNFTNFTVTESSCTSPTISVTNLPASGTINNDLNTCGASVTLGANITTTGTPIPTVTYSLSNFGPTISNPYVFPVGTTTVWAKASNSCGDAITSFTVTVTDDEAPTVTATTDVETNTSADASGDCTVAVVITDATFGDNCSSNLSWVMTGATTGSGTGQVGTQTFNIGVTTITYTNTDGAPLTATDAMTVTVTDNEAPTIISCAENITVLLDLGQTTASGFSLGSPTVSDNCGILSPATNNATSTYTLGTHTITWTVMDTNGNLNTCQQTITVNKRPTAIEYTGDLIEQYSDQQTLKAVLKDQLTNTPLSGKTVGFSIGTQSVSDGPDLPSNGTDGSGVAEANLILTQAPGNSYNVISSFGGDDTYLPSSNTTSFTISKENVDITYTGLPYFSTTSATSCTATVTLSATIKDITALGGTDVNAGDIKNATVTFRNGSPAGPILGTANIPVILVSSGNTMVGTVSTTFDYTLSPTECTSKGTTLDVYVVVNNYYKGDNCLDPGTVTISVPGSESVTGGGFIKMQNSTGTYAGTTGTKTNFGFTMKWTKSGTNVKGQANIIIRRNGRVYQIKSNAISSLSVNGSSGNFVTKANMKDITDPLNPFSIGGNSDLYVNMYDGSAGGQLDEISILYQTGSTIIYSSHWNGSATVRRLLDGGNIQVRTGSSTTKDEETAQSSDTKQKVAIIAVPEKSIEPEPFNVTVYPNPSKDNFSLSLTGSSNEKVEIDIFDMQGRKIKHIESTNQQSIVFGEELPSGTYIAIVSQGINQKTIRLIKE